MSKSYFVRTCFRNPEGLLESHGAEAKGFIWPEEIGAVVTCPDWDPTPTEEHGLWGIRPYRDHESRIPQYSMRGPIVWMVCSYEEGTEVEISVPCKDTEDHSTSFTFIKVPVCTVEFIAQEDRRAPQKAVRSIVNWLHEHGYDDIPFKRLSVTGLHSHGALDEGFVYAGNWSSAVVNTHKHVTTGPFYMTKVGDYSHTVTGNHSIAVTGNHSNAVVGNHSLVDTGDFSFARAGDFGSAISGKHGTSFAKLFSTVSAGEGGTLLSTWIDDNADTRIAIAYVGENGIKPNTLYKVDAHGNFVEAHVECLTVSEKSKAASKAKLAEVLKAIRNPVVP